MLNQRYQNCFPLNLLKFTKNSPQRNKNEQTYQQHVFCQKQNQNSSQQILQLNLTSQFFYHCRNYRKMHYYILDSSIFKFINFFILQEQQFVYRLKLYKFSILQRHMPVEAFAAKSHNANILRVYTLRLSYEYCRQLDRDKSISSGLASHCIIVRQKPTLNKTDFGYKQELKTGVLKKMHFVYLQKIQDLIAFLYQHIKFLQENVTQPNQTKTFMKIQPSTRASPLFGMLLVENIESYFGNVVDQQNMGTKMFLFLKLLKVLDNLMPFNSNICFTYNYNQDVCNFQDFLAYVKSENITCWKVGVKKLQKNGYSYESEWTRKFYEIYEVEDENPDDEDDIVEIQKTIKKR